MTITVSISDFRQHISNYLAQVQAGDKIVLRDEKKDEDVAELIGKKKFDSKRFWKVLKKNSGIFSAKNHPEWRTKRQVIAWVEKGRRDAERTF